MKKKNCSLKKIDLLQYKSRIDRYVEKVGMFIYFFIFKTLINITFTSPQFYCYY